jgi:hypothetical protein
MIDPLEAAWEIHCFMTVQHIPYVIIGGVAVQYWGEPRLTGDVDITAAVPLEKAEDFVQLIVSHFTPRVSNPLDFALKTRMILIRASNGFKIDISMSLPGYEDEVMARAVEYELATGKQIRLCSAEDLIIHKTVAGRPQDLYDIESVVYRQGKSLDVKYIRFWIQEFSLIIGNPEMPERFEVPWRKLHRK